MILIIYFITRIVLIIYSNDVNVLVHIFYVEKKYIIVETVWSTLMSFKIK